MRETRTRSIVKALIWRAVALTVTYLVAWLFTGSIETSLLIALIANFLKTILYYILERIFQGISWGYLEESE